MCEADNEQRKSEMSNKQIEIINHLQDLVDNGFMTQYEYNWCIGAINNRHELTQETRNQLLNTVLEIMKQVKTRIQ